MAHPRTFSAAVLPAALLLLTTCGHDVTAPPAPTQLVFIAQPRNIVAGHEFSQAVQVQAEDAHGNKVASFVGNVTVALASNPGGSTLSGTTTVGAVDGIAIFYNLSLDKTGAGYTLTASAAGGGLAAPTSAAFDVAPGPATQLEFTVESTTVTAGAPLAPPLQVSALDPEGNPVPGFTGDVTVAFGGTSGAGATLGGTTTVAAVHGVATFGDLTVSKAGTGYWLTGSSTGLARAASDAFEVTAGAATQLVFGTQPGTTVADHNITPAVKVRALDALGNLVPSFTGNVSIAPGTNPGGATLSGTTPVAAIGGVATFYDLSLNKTATGYTLTASGSGFAPVTSAPFDITPGAATQLAFTAQPTNTVAGAIISPAVQVTALDPAGNAVPGFTGSVTVAFGNNPGGSTLSGTTTVAAVNGVASFGDLSANKTGTSYALSATAVGLIPTTSSGFSITPGAATQLVFGTQPSTTVANRQISPAVKVRALDAFGNVATEFTGPVAIALGSNPGGSTLSGTTPVAAVSGVATFFVSLNKTGTGYTLTASAGGFAPVTSTAFDITPGTATQLAFIVQPSNTVAGAAINPAVEVTALDPAGNPVPSFTGSVAVALGNNPGGSTLSGTTTVAAVNGVATFVDLSLNKTGTGYTLTASVSGFTSATSTAFDIIPGTATRLAFTVQPSNTVAGAAISPAVQVTALDAAGNPVPSFTGSVTVALGTNPGGSTLSGTTTVAAANGVASFSPLTLDKTGTSYALIATAAGLNQATSSGFNITPGAATQLVFGTQPSTTVANRQISPAVKVRALDAFGNVATGFTDAVAIALGSNPGGSTLSGTTAVAAAGGVATFFDLSVNKTGTGYTLTASASGFTSVTSTPFDITPGAATQLAFSVQPSTTVAGAAISPAVQVTALDPEI